MDLIQESEKRIKDSGIKSVDDVRKSSVRYIDLSDKTNELRTPLREFLHKNLYRHYSVVRMNDKAKRFLTDLFNVYLNRPEQLPLDIQQKLTADDKHRIICDYIAGMTDRFALDEYKKLFDPYEKV